VAVDDVSRLRLNLPLVFFLVGRLVGLTNISVAKAFDIV
jgi:hypothetical protein